MARLLLRLRDGGLAGSMFERAGISVALTVDMVLPAQLFGLGWGTTVGDSCRCRNLAAFESLNLRFQFLDTVLQPSDGFSCKSES